MELCAEAARHRLGEVIGGESGLQLIEAQRRMRELGVRAPERMLRVIAPPASAPAF